MVALLSHAGCRVSQSGFWGFGEDLPWRCTVTFADGSFRKFSLYFWTISHGGRSRSQQEYRIQAKLKTSRSLVFTHGTTLLLGYYSSDYDRVGREEGNVPFDDMEILVAWD